MSLFLTLPVKMPKDLPVRLCHLRAHAPAVMILFSVSTAQFAF
jgi:hypothetical protein